MPSCSKLESIPGVVLDEIIVSLAALSDFAGPPSNMLTTLLLSKEILRKISLPWIYSQIFFLKFDRRPVVPQLGNDLQRGILAQFAAELVRRFECLNRLKDDNYAALENPELFKKDLWTAYLMFLESEDKNARQLIDYARVDLLALNYVSLGGLLHQGTVSNWGWTVDNECNALAMWIFWFTDRARIENETPMERDMILTALYPYFVGSLKYASTYAPITSFFIPSARLPVPSDLGFIRPLASSPVMPVCKVSDYFGLEFDIAQPLTLPPALLSSAVRLEAISAEMIRSADMTHNEAPAQAAVATGWIGPTAEDIYKQILVQTPCIDWDEHEHNGIWRNEHDWNRLCVCVEPWSGPVMRGRVFTPGMLHGNWIGNLLITPAEEFEDLVSRRAPSPHPPQVHHVPMQFYLREHHQRNREDMAEFDDMLWPDAVHGVFNAWFPQNTTRTEVNNDLIVYDPSAEKTSTYRTFDPAAVTFNESHSQEYGGLYGDGVWDVILSAETDKAFGQAWGNERYYGRVRDWDGLVVLVREGEQNGRSSIFYGYVHGRQNLVGRWRDIGIQVEDIGWSGVLRMMKQD